MLGRAIVIPLFKVHASTMAVKFGCHSNIGAGGAFKTFCLEFLVDETVDIGIKVGCRASMCAGSNRVVKGR